MCILYMLLYMAKARLAAAATRFLCAFYKACPRYDIQTCHHFDANRSSSSHVCSHIQIGMRHILMKVQQQPLTCLSSELPCDCEPHGSSAASGGARRGLPTCAPQRPPCPQPTPAHQWPEGTPPRHQGMLWDLTSLLQSLQVNNQGTQELKDGECPKLLSFRLLLA